MMTAGLSVSTAPSPSVCSGNLHILEREGKLANDRAAVRVSTNQLPPCQAYSVLLLSETNGGYRGESQSWLLPWYGG